MKPLPLFLARSAVLLLVLAAMEVGPRAIDKAFVIVPLSVATRALIALFATTEFWANAHVTFTEVLLSFTIATVVGIPAGVVMGLRRPVFEGVEPYLIAYYANPIFVFYPILISFFGLNILPIVVIAVLASVIGVIVNTAIGIVRLRPVFRRVGESLGMSQGQILWRIQLPGAVPHVFTGLRLGLVYSFLAVITSEFLLAPRGLGTFIKSQYESFQSAQMYAGILFIVGSAVAINTVLIHVEHRLYSRRLVGG